MRFRLRGAALDWWVALVNSRARNGSGNLFSPPESGEQEPITLVNTIQPTLIVDPADLESDLRLLPILVSSPIGAFIDRNGSRVQEFELPLYDVTAIDNTLRALYGADPGLRPVVSLLSIGARGYADNNGSPDYNTPIAVSFGQTAGVAVQLRVGGEPVGFMGSGSIEAGYYDFYFTLPNSNEAPRQLPTELPAPNAAITATVKMNKSAPSRWVFVNATVVVYPSAGAVRPLSAAISISSLNTPRQLV